MLSSGLASLTVTLDTSLLLEYWNLQDKHAIVQCLLDLARNGVIDIVVTSRVRYDIPKPRLSLEIDRLPELNVTEGPSVTRLGGWLLGRDGLGDEHFAALAEELQQLLRMRGRRNKLPEWRDWDHVHAHYLSGRSAFLTWDGGSLEVGPELQSRLGVTVRSPEGWLSENGL
jgi:hypothetical protein